VALLGVPCGIAGALAYWVVLKRNRDLLRTAQT